MYESIGGETGKYPLVSMYNYLHSIYSILSNKNFPDFAQERLDYYSSLNLRKIRLGDKGKRFLFEQFFFAYKLMNNLDFLSRQSDNRKITLIQLATMTFYYSSYSFVNCFNYVCNKYIQKTHTKTFRTFSTYCHQLSFPFKLTGRLDDASKNAKFKFDHGRENYPDGFENNRDKYALQQKSMDGFDYKSAIYAYLKGTHRFYWDNSINKSEAIKEIKKLGLENFRKKQAREIRNNKFTHLPDANYLNSLFRIRGKVNYRDSIFSLYDIKPGDLLNSYEKGIKLPHIMVEILKYFSIDIESYVIHKLYQTEFHREMLDDIIIHTDRYNLDFPKFQRELFYA